MTDSQENENWEPGTDLRVRLKFDSRSYSLNEFVETIEGIEALMVLSELEDVDLPREADWRGQVVPSQDLVPKWYELQRSKTTQHISVERVSLSSPSK